MFFKLAQCDRIKSVTWLSLLTKKTKMNFQANMDTAEKCFNKYKLNAFLYICFFVFVALGNVVSTYQRYHHVLFTIFFTLLTLAIFFAGIYSVYRGSISMNISFNSSPIYKFWRL